MCQGKAGVDISCNSGANIPFWSMSGKYYRIAAQENELIVLFSYLRTMAGRRVREAVKSVSCRLTATNIYSYPCPSFSVKNGHKAAHSIAKCNKRKYENTKPHYTYNLLPITYDLFASSSIKHIK